MKKTTVIIYYVNNKLVCHASTWNNTLRNWERTFELKDPNCPYTKNFRRVETVRGESEIHLNGIINALHVSVDDIERREIERDATVYETYPDLPIDDMSSDDILEMLPTHKVVCSRCNGRGSHDPDAWSNGFTTSEFNELFETPEERNDYFSGAYDVPCEECHGNNVVDDVNEDVLNDNEEVLFKYLQERYQEEADSRATMEAERRMGC